MIIREEGPALTLVTQPDHAQLARQIMDHWVTEGLSTTPHRTSILLAIAEHDNGWREVDATPLVDASSGRLLDFISVPLEVRQGVWPRGADRLAADPVAAALVCEHAIQVYRRLWDDAAWVPFFTRMKGVRSAFAEAAGVPLATIARDYFFVRIADLVSLAFCAHWQESAEGIEWRGYTVRRAGSEVVVSPDPFGGLRIPLEVAARQMPNRRYTTAEDAASAFGAGPEVRLSGTLHG